MLTWPHKDTDWLNWLDDIEAVYIELCQQITRFQKVVVACHDQSLEIHVLKLLSENNVNPSAVRTFIAPCNDTWARDHGPITLIRPNELNNDLELEYETQICDFTFNAWGDKYQASLDDKINQSLIMQPFCNLQHYQNYDFVLEGGSIESDGNGSLLTTEKCLLNPNRNNKYSKQEIEQGLIDLLGVDQIHWLQHGSLAGDDTDAHVDTLARFAPNGIVYVTCDDENSVNYHELQLMEQELGLLKNTKGEKYKLFGLPSPKAKYNDEGEQLPATYANFLVINNAVLVPTYNDDNDERALEIISDAFTGYEVIGIDCCTVIQQFGSLHCLTMQIPEGLIL